jgi:beta-mannanase
VSILHWGQSWFADGVPQPFYWRNFDAVRARGAIPLIDWASWDSADGDKPDQPGFQLRDIIKGRYDAYIRSWATGAKDWGHPLFLRFDHEMNGSWYPWSELRNGNAAGQYVKAWQHVHDIFASVGATNVTWVWCPNTVYPGSIPLARLYPGSSYVDWVGLDVYNWGTNPVKPAGWRSFSQVASATYQQLGQIAPSKPVMLAEVASSEMGGSKAAWITDALRQLPTRFSRIRAVVWFDWNAQRMDWSIDSSKSARAAFARSISSPTYTSDSFRTLSSSPIPPP